MVHNTYTEKYGHVLFWYRKTEATTAVKARDPFRQCLLFFARVSWRAPSTDSRLSWPFPGDADKVSAVLPIGANCRQTERRRKDGRARSRATVFRPKASSSTEMGRGCHSRLGTGCRRSVVYDAPGIHKIEPKGFGPADLGRMAGPVGKSSVCYGGPRPGRFKSGKRAPLASASFGSGDVRRYTDRRAGAGHHQMDSMGASLLVGRNHDAARTAINRRARELAFRAKIAVDIFVPGGSNTLAGSRPA